MTEKPEQPAQPTHVALRLELFLAVMKTIGSLPWEQANPMMAELQKSPQITLDQNQAPTNDQPRLDPARS